MKARSYLIAPSVKRRLRIYNAVAGLVHLAQAIAVLGLSNDFSIPVTSVFLEGPPGTEPESITTLFDIRVGWSVAAFLLVSATAHTVLVTPWVFSWYIKQLETYRNYARWIEYSFSASLMIVLIALLHGITDIAALIPLFGVNASMILFGLLMEKYEHPGNASWIAYWFGVFAGAIPWVAIALYLWSPGNAVEPPGFVYGIFFSLFVFFNIFAVNMVFQYRMTWRWRNYLFGEYIYILLSLTAKSLLAWQVFAGALASG